MTQPNPLVCPLCGGKRPAYSTTRKTRFRIQYRRCETCGELSKTLAYIDQPRRLTPNELATIARLLPDCAHLVSPGSGRAVFLVTRDADLAEN